MLIAGFVFALMNVFVKLLPNINPVEIVFFRSLVSFVMSLVMLRLYKIPPLGKNTILLVARGAVGAVALVMYFTTLQLMPLASAVTIQFLSPIFTSILGVFIVREKVLSKQWLFYAVAFFGVMVIQGFDPRVPFWVAVLGLVSAIFSGLAYNIIRRLNNLEHPLVIVFYFPLVTIPLTAIYLLFNWDVPDGYDLLVLLMIGILTQIAQLYMTKAYQSDELSKVASLKYLGIVYALGFGFVFFEETYQWPSLAGIGLVLAGVVANVWYKSKKDALRMK